MLCKVNMQDLAVLTTNLSMTYQCQVNHIHKYVKGLVSAGCYVTEENLEIELEKINMQEWKVGYEENSSFL